MQEPILVPGPQLHKSKDQNSNQESNESVNQNSNKKRKPNDHARIQPLSRHKTATFFLLLAAKVRSSCEEGPGQSALQSAYNDPQLDVTELKQNRTTKSFRPKIANKQINKLNRRRRWQKSVGSKSVQGEDRITGS